MWKRLVCVLATTALLQTAGAAQQAEEQFQQARTKEIVSGDLEGAIRIYADLAGSRGTSRQLAAQSLLESARLHEALGRKEQAVRVLNQIVAQHPDQSEILAKARQRLAALAPANGPVRIDLPFTMDAFSFALSPDGSKLVQSVAFADRGELWLRDLRTGRSAPIPGATLERGAYLTALPFWSPDGSSIAYFSGGRLMRIDVAGGKPRVLADAPGRGGGSWAGDFIVYNGDADYVPSRFRVVRADGGAPPSVLGFGGHQPSFLPDGKHFLFLRVGAGWQYGQATASLWIGSIDGGIEKNLPVAANTGAFVAPDTLLYVVQQEVFAQRMDMTSFELLGEPRKIADRVLTGMPKWGLRAIAASRSGSLAFASSRPASQRQLVWLDRAGRQTGAVRAPESAELTYARISPDGRQVVLTRRDVSSTIPRSLVWEEGRPERLVSQGSLSGIWSPSGDVVLSQSSPDDVGPFLVLFSREADGWQRRDLRNVPGAEDVPQDWSRDGRHLLFGGLSRGDIRVLDMEDETTRPLVELPGYATGARFAPDGRWFAYQYNDQSTGDVRRTQVFVQPFSGTARDAVQVTTAGGTSPVWSSDGSRLHYLSFDDDLTEIEVHHAADGGIQLGRPRVLFRVPPGSEFDVHPDGSGFLVNRLVATEPFSITVLPNAGR